MYYRIPSNLLEEICELDTYIGQFRAGALEAGALKSRRVPFGCYEQRRDGSYMLRIRTTGGAITPLQLKAIGEISERYGSPSLHITTRQEFQIHDLKLENVIPAMRALLAAGLSTRGGGGNTVRNILLSPDAGIRADEAFDPSPYVFALTSRMIAEANSWTLPRKLKLAFSNTPEDTAYARFNDIGFIATSKDGRKGFSVFVAGGLGGKPEVGHLLFDFVPAEDAYIVAEAVKRLFDQHGNRKNRNQARLRFLWSRLGEEKFRALYAQEEARLRADPRAPLTPELPPPPSQDTATVPLSASGADYEIWKTRYVEAQAQPGYCSVVLPASLGTLRNVHAVALGEWLSRIGEDTVRADFGQNLRLRNIPVSLLGNVYHLVRTFDPLSEKPRFLSNSVACTGADTCKLGICLPKGALQAISRALTKSGLSLDDIPGLRLNISGCPNTCGQHMLADLGFFGSVGRKSDRIYPAYAIVAGARTRLGAARLATVFGRVPARSLPKVVEELLGLWLEKKDRFGSYAEYVDTEGAADIERVRQKYAAVPDFEDDRTPYFDWGAKEPFSLVGRGVGECSAGLFDLIDLDLKEAERLRGIAAADKNDGDGDSLLPLALRTARALLITRGIEAGSDVQIYSAFLQHFIAAGLISDRFAPAIEAAKAGQPLIPHRNDLFALLDEVTSLYANMDNSLRFPAEQVGASAAPAASVPADIERDYRTVACPLNFVKVKFDLAQMTSGQKLKIVLGDGDPIRNVPQSVALEGHKVLRQDKIGDVWEVVIEKV